MAFNLKKMFGKEASDDYVEIDVSQVGARKEKNKSKTICSKKI